MGRTQETVAARQFVAPEREAAASVGRRRGEVHCQVVGKREREGVAVGHGASVKPPTAKRETSLSCHSYSVADAAPRAERKERFYGRLTVRLLDLDSKTLYACS